MAKCCKTSSEVAGYENANNKIGEAHPEVIARMKEVESYHFNL